MNSNVVKNSASGIVGSVAKQGTRDISTSPIGAGRESALTKERRRSQRVLLRVRVKLYFALGGKENTVETVTLNVNTHGALVLIPQSLPLGTALILEHAGTKERVGCKVVRMPVESPDGHQTALEFDASSPQFWRIAFPPTDWSPVEP